MAKVTKSLTLVSFVRFLLVEYTYQNMKSLSPTVQKLWTMFLPQTESTHAPNFWILQILSYLTEPFTLSFWWVVLRFYVISTVFHDLEVGDT